VRRARGRADVEAQTSTAMQKWRIVTLGIGTG
jgi:hypothetical protein